MPRGNPKTCPHGVTPTRACAACKRESSRRSAAKHPLAARDRNLRRLYGITLEEYDEQMIKQRGGCAICGTPPKNRALHVDHDHKTGDVRGILCWWCNALVGKLKGRADIAEAAAKYLRAEPLTRGTAVLGPIRKRKRRPS